MKIFTENVLFKYAIKMTRQIVGVVMVLFGALTPIFSTPANASFLYVAAYDATNPNAAPNPLVYAVGSGPLANQFALLNINVLGFTAAIDVSFTNFGGTQYGGAIHTTITEMNQYDSSIGQGRSLGIFTAVLDSLPVGTEQELPGAGIANLAYTQWTAPVGNAYVQTADTSTTSGIVPVTQGNAQTTTVVLRGVNATSNTSLSVALNNNIEGLVSNTFNGSIPPYALIQKLVISAPNDGASFFTVHGHSTVAAVPIPPAMLFVAPALAAVFGFARKKSGNTVAI